MSFDLSRYPGPSNLEISRDAAARSDVERAIAARRQDQRIPWSHRMRHALALRLASAAHLVDVR